MTSASFQFAYSLHLRKKIRRGGSVGTTAFSRSFHLPFHSDDIFSDHIIRPLLRRIFEHFIDLDLCLRRCYNSCYPMSFIFVCQFSFHRSDRANPSTTCGPRMERRDELACSDLQQIAPSSVANQLQKNIRMRNRMISTSCTNFRAFAWQEWRASPWRIHSDYETMD